MLQFVPVTPCRVTGHHWKESGPVLMTLTIKIFITFRYLYLAIKKLISIYKYIYFLYTFLQLNPRFNLFDAICS